MKPSRQVLKRGILNTILVFVFLFTNTFSTFRASPAVAAPPATCGAGDPGVVAGNCSVTIDARDFPSDIPLANFNYIINVDNTKLPSDPLALNSESFSPIVREGGQAHPTVTLPDGRYMVSARSTDHKMWGAYFTLPNDADSNGNLTVTISLTVQSADNPLPLGKIRVFVFNDNAWTNSAPDTEEGGLGGFKVELAEETNSPVTVDYNNNPLCGGTCVTDNTGFVEIPDLGPAGYFIDVHPPDGPCNSDPNSYWYQTTTIDGGLPLYAPTEEGADGTGAPGEQLWEPPNNRTAYWFGFVCEPHDFATPGTGEIVGQARNWVEWAPFTTGTWNEPVANPFVALSDSSTDQTIYVGRGDAAGNFDIPNVPAGSYNLSIWDEQLSYIMRFKPVDVAAGQLVDVDDVDDAGNSGVGVSRWFGWLGGIVYKDVNNNGQYDEGIDTPIPNTDMDQRWRDGSIKEGTFTDANGYYEYPTAEGGSLGRWIVNEQGFARFSSYPGPSLHDEHTGAVIPSCAVDPPAVPANPCLPTDQGGGLLTNQLLSEGHRATVDWGKRDYPAGTPGQIVGITYFATTRNEFDARFQAHEDYEPAIPDVTVYLETLGGDGLPNTADDVIVNKYVTDHWQQPSASQDPQAGGNTFTQNCVPIRDYTWGNTASVRFSQPPWISVDPCLHSRPSDQLQGPILCHGDDEDIQPAPDTRYSMLLQHAQLIIGMLYLTLPAGLFLTNEQVKYFRAFGPDMAIAIDAARSRRLNGFLRKNIETEHKQITRELHDNMAHDLIYIRNQLDLLAVGQGARPSAQVQQKLEKIREVVETVYVDLRTTLKGLESSLWTDLSEDIQEFVLSIQRQSSYQIHYSKQGQSQPVTTQDALQILFILKEVLANIENHAQASQVRVILSWLNDGVSLSVADNGCGFDAEAATAEGHMGLKIIRQRADEIGAQLILKSVQGAGTEVNLWLPHWDRYPVTAKLPVHNS